MNPNPASTMDIADVHAVCPWGSIGRLRTDIESACRSRDEGGTNIAYDFWEWTSNQVEQYCIKEDPSTGDAV